jgi:multiple sugar transport system permease protein
LAGLVGVPKEPLEAAAVNNANAWQTFWHIILPSLRPIMVVGFLLRFTDLYKIFDTIWITTGGGPGISTESVSLYGYRVNFSYWHIGYGSAVVFVIFLISYIACLIFSHTVVPPEKKLK